MKELLAAFLILIVSPALAHDMRGLGHKSMQINAKVSHAVIRNQAERQADPDAKYIFQRLLLWKQGQRLKACFMDGTAAEKAHVIGAAAELLRRTTANLHFDFGSAPNYRACDFSKTPIDDVRVSFAYGCCNAYVGRNAHSPDPYVQQGPSINLEGILLQPDKQRIAMHELMHVMGFEHEHQAPDSPCEGEFIKEEIKKNTGWDDATYEVNLKPLARDHRSYKWSANDENSLMQYYFLETELKNGKNSPCFTGNNMVPSQRDIEGAQDAYPQGTARVAPARTKALMFGIAGSNAPAEVRDLARALATLD